MCAQETCKPKIALITGIAGQDGAYLAEFLLSKGYDVHGLLRWDSHADPLISMQRLNMLGLVNENITLHYGDITDANCINALIKDIQPNEIYNLAALSHVQVSFTTPSSVLDINTKGVLNILDAVRVLELEKTTKIYQASSSEMFGSTPAPQSEQTPMTPCSPYGIAKLAAYHLVRVYRESYSLFASNGILFNHESPLRGEDFVTKKITRSIAAIEAGQMEYMTLGNLDSIRDWGHARDYIRGMWMMLQQDTPGDYILATGTAHTVREFVQRAFAYIGIQIKWQGDGLYETGINAQTGELLVAVDETLFRPLEVNHLLGDTQKAQSELGWKPETDLDTLIQDMIDADRQTIKTKSSNTDKNTNDDTNMAQRRALS